MLVYSLILVNKKVAVEVGLCVVVDEIIAQANHIEALGVRKNNYSS